MAGIGHQIHHSRAAAEPGRQHRNQIPHGHHQAVVTAVAYQGHDPAEEILHLPLPQFGEASPQAGVTKPTGTEVAGRANHPEAGPAVGLASADKR